MGFFEFATAQMESARWVTEIKEYNEAASAHAKAESRAQEVDESKGHGFEPKLSSGVRSALRKFYPKSNIFYRTDKRDYIVHCDRANIPLKRRQNH